MLKKLLKFLDNLEEKILTILLPSMVIIVFLATFFRFTKLAIIPWSEEIARYFMVWIIFIGMGAGAKKNQHFTVDNFVNALPKSLHKVFFMLRTVMIVGFCITVVILSGDLINKLYSMGQLSPALRVPMWIMYSAIPVGCILMIIRSIQFLINEYKEEEEANL